MKYTGLMDQVERAFYAGERTAADRLELSVQFLNAAIRSGWTGPFPAWVLRAAPEIFGTGPAKRCEFRHGGTAAAV